MSELNGVPPRPIPADVGLALQYFDLAAHILSGQANQMQALAEGNGSNVLRRTALVLAELAATARQNRIELLEAAQKAIVIAQPGDLPRRPQ